MNLNTSAAPANKAVVKPIILKDIKKANGSITPNSGGKPSLIDGLLHNNYQAVEVKIEDGVTYVGKYKIGKDLGKGTFGKVKVGTHTVNGEKVAIKVLEKDKIIDVNDVERVAREIHILKIVRHPVVV
jgi:hypothetical protein